MLISQSRFINNCVPYVMVYVTDESNNTYMDKIGRILQARDKSITSIRYSEFVGNNVSVPIVEAYGRVIVSVDHGTFTKTQEGYCSQRILTR